MAQKLSRRKKINPTVHSVEAVTAIVVGNTVDLLIRQDIERVPLGKLLRQPRDDFCAVVILRTGCSVAALPFWLAKLPGLQTSLDPTLVGHGEELISHLARLGLAL